MSDNKSNLHSYAPGRAYSIIIIGSKETLPPGTPPGGFLSIKFHLIGFRGSPKEKNKRRKTKGQGKKGGKGKKEEEKNI